MLSDLKGQSHLSFSPSATLRLVLSTPTPSRGCRGWCGQASLHRSPQTSAPTAQRSLGDHSTGINETRCKKLALVFLIICWHDVCLCDCVPRSRVYMADLESTLHYSLRVELAAHPVIKGEALISLKKYISVLAKVQIPERSLHTHIQYTHKRHTKRVNQIKYID